MKNQLKQNVRLAFAGIALLFVAAVASVKADVAGSASVQHTAQIKNFGSPVPICMPDGKCY